MDSPTTGEKLSAREREKQKTKEELIQATAYVLNHSISCGTTDIFIQPPIGSWVETAAEQDKLPRWLKWITNIFEKHEHHGHGGHDHHHHHGHDHDHSHKTPHPKGPLRASPAGKISGRTFSLAPPTAEKPHVHGPSCGHGSGEGFWKKLLHNAAHWFTGEIVGDLGAVPLTVMVHHNAPGLMRGLRNLLEPVAGGIFRRGARNDARKWAMQQGLSPDSAEAKAKQAELYEHEISHLPLAIVWNAFSIPINLMAQKIQGSKASLGVMAVGKIFGAVVSNTLLIGGRALAPEAFNKWDRFTSKHLLIPATNAAGKILGIDDETLKKVQREHQKEESAESKQDISKAEKLRRNNEINWQEKEKSRPDITGMAMKV